MKTVAGIDIGTNTILLLIAQLNDDKDDGKNSDKKNDTNDSNYYPKIHKIIADEHRIARLGEGVNQSGIISDKALNRALDILEEYNNILDHHHIDKLRVVCTSAVRDAKNKNQVLASLSKKIGVTVETISGEEEAELSFLGSTINNNNQKIIDIGGGSTEFISGENNQINYKISLNIGAVRITEMFFSSYPPSKTEISKANEFITAELKKLKLNNISKTLIAVAGTPTSLSQIALSLKKFQREEIHLHKMSINELKETINILKTNNLETLINKFYIHPKRADVLLGGALILLEFIKYLSINSFITSANGLRYGLVLNILKKNN